MGIPLGWQAPGAPGPRLATSADRGLRPGPGLRTGRPHLERVEAPGPRQPRMETALVTTGKADRPTVRDEFGPLARVLAARFFEGVRFPAEAQSQLRELEDRGLVVHVMRTTAARGRCLTRPRAGLVRSVGLRCTAAQLARRC